MTRTLPTLLAPIFNHVHCVIIKITVFQLICLTLMLIRTSSGHCTGYGHCIYGNYHTVHHVHDHLQYLVV